MKLSPKQLASVGRALYGDNWKTALATLIGVSERTMRRYAGKGVTLPGHTIRDIRRAMVNQIDTLTAQLNGLRNGEIEDD